MREFPDITLPDPDYALWLWVIVPLILAGLFLWSEQIIERVTEKRRGKPTVGVGYILMGISLLVGVMAFTLVPDYIEATRATAAVSALESIGFQDVRISLDKGTFGAYYDGELMRGVIVPDVAHPGNYSVYETPPPGGFPSE